MGRNSRYLAYERPHASSWLLANKILIDGGLLAMSLLPSPFAVVVRMQGLVFLAQVYANGALRIH
jgi:hypothetical protein